MAIGRSCSIEYLAPAFPGDAITATAAEQAVVIAVRSRRRGHTRRGRPAPPGIASSKPPARRSTQSVTTTAAATERTRSDLSEAAAETAVIWAGLFALGIGFGVLVTSHGLPWWLAPVISASMFAGSVEFILIGMLAAGAPIPAIGVTTFLVNFRHVFYGLSFPLHRVAGWHRKAYSVFALCDEAYALLTSKDPSTLTTARILWTQFGLHASWAVGSLTGAAIGSNLLANVEGLGFVLIPLFVVLALDAWRANSDTATLLLAVGAALLAKLAAPNQMLLVAMTTFAVTITIRHHLDRSGHDDT